MEDKLKYQSRANERHHDHILEERKELEHKKSEEALLLVQKRYDLWRFQNERDEARKTAEFLKLEKSEEGAGPAASYLL